MDSRLRIIVLGYIVRGPLGGMVASNLQYLLGLSRLGHEVYFAEDSDDYASCYDPRAGRMTTDPTTGLEFAAETLGWIGLGERWAYHDAHTGRWLGPAGERMVELARSADLVLNLCGVNPMRPWWRQAPVRVLVDEDPGFTQIKHLQNPEAAEAARLHNAFFSFAENVGRPECRIPDDALPWRPTRQPIVPDSWPFADVTDTGRYTTVMQWRSYRTVEHEGVEYGMKRESFEPFAALPTRVGPEMEMAVAGLGGASRRRLESLGWVITDPGGLSRTPETYRSYLQQSRAEFSVAKHGYVVTRSGWFSERSACYLASGRPVILQDTGYPRRLPTGQGLLAFDDLDSAIAAIESVERDYPAHRRAARELAVVHFDARAILSDLLEKAHEAADQNPFDSEGV